LEDHRKRYAEGYRALRVFDPNPESLIEVIQQVNEKDRQIKEIKKQLEAKDIELETVRSELSALANLVKQVSNTDYYKKMFEEIAERMAEKLVQDPEFVEKFKEEAGKLKSGYFKKQQKE
jgi:DNA-binding transcriptional MerR regulator